MEGQRLDAEKGKRQRANVKITGMAETPAPLAIV